MQTTKCATLMQLLLQKLNKENGVGTHYFTSSQQFPLCGPLPPTFPWTHNNHEAMTIGDRIYNMERVGVFYLVWWCVRLGFTHFQKG